MNKTFISTAAATLFLMIAAGLAADYDMKGLCAALTFGALGGLACAMFTWDAPDA